MLKSWTTSFQVNGQWYDMDEAIYQFGKRRSGSDWTNAKIIETLKSHGYKFSTDPKNGFITIS